MGRTYELEDHVGFGAAQRQVADFVDDEQGWPQVGLELAVELGVPGTGVPSWESKRPGAWRLGPRYRERRHHDTRPARLRYHLRSLPNNAQRDPTTWKASWPCSTRPGDPRRTTAAP
jgi:hypothetical protein